jgi:SEC-C motif-containing protein
VKIDAPLPPWWRDLLSPSQSVRVSLGDAVVAAGDSGLRAVCAVLDPRFAKRPIPQASTDGRVFCASLLSRFARPELIPWMFELLVAGDGEDPISPELADALAACGSAAGEEAVARFADSEPGDLLRPWLAEIVAHAGHRSDEALAALVAYLHDDPIHGAQLLADYGDASAVEALTMEFDLTPHEGPDAEPQMLTMIGSAIVALGGRLDEARAAILGSSEEFACLARVAQRRRIIEWNGFGGGVPRPASDDACPCEAGRKYAECCETLERELEERHLARRATRWPE